MSNLGGRARNISYNTLQLHQKAQMLVILYGYLNKLFIYTRIASVTAMIKERQEHKSLILCGNNNHKSLHFIFWERV